MKPEGILFAHGQKLVKNEELVVVLRMGEQELSFEPSAMKAMDTQVLRALGVKPGEELKSSIQYSAMNEVLGLKHWVTQMHERVFL